MELSWNLFHSDIANIKGNFIALYRFVINLILRAFIQIQYSRETFLFSTLSVWSSSQPLAKKSSNPVPQHFPHSSRWSPWQSILGFHGASPPCCSCTHWDLRNGMRSTTKPLGRLRRNFRAICHYPCLLLWKQSHWVLTTSLWDLNYLCHIPRCWDCTTDSAAPWNCDRGRCETCFGNPPAPPSTPKCRGLWCWKWSSGPASILWKPCSKNELASVFYLLLFLRSPSRSHPRLLMRKSPGGFRTGLVSELLSILHSSQDAIYNNAIFYLDILLVLFELCSQLMLNCLGFVALPPGPSDVGLACWVGRWGW